MEPSSNRPRFSDRIGATQPRTALQIGSMDNDLRNTIWNGLIILLDKGDAWEVAANYVAMNMIKVPVDHSDQRITGQSKYWIRTLYFGEEDKCYEMSWFDVYNLLELIAENIESITRRRVSLQGFESLMNECFKRELAGYRMINGLVVPITDEGEIAAITNAIGDADTYGLRGVGVHLKAALQLMSLKPEADYRNSIKESISSVEAVAKHIVGTDQGGLKAALEALNKKAPIHGSMREGFLKLYGYTSDQDGIRHAMLQQADIGFDEAKFMLVACSAFVHFLICKAHGVSLL